MVCCEKIAEQLRGSDSASDALLQRPRRFCVEELLRLLLTTEDNTVRKMGPTVLINMSRSDVFGGPESEVYQRLLEDETNPEKGCLLMS
jgi:hypothetical protein